jgi:hypothetical protein
MHGTRGSRAGIRRYKCSTPRYHGACEQMMLSAEPLEGQLVDWLRDFQPDDDLRDQVLSAILAQSSDQDDDGTDRRRDLSGQLERLRELHVIGDLTRAQYMMRRQALEEELQRTAPPTDPDLDRARAVLEDFARFWQLERDPVERRKLLLSLFTQVWAKDRAIVAAKPNAAFARYFTVISDARSNRTKATGKAGVTMTGATGLEPAFVTPEIEIRIQPRSSRAEQTTGDGTRRACRCDATRCAGRRRAARCHTRTWRVRRAPSSSPTRLDSP